MNLKIKDIIRITGGTLLCGDMEEECTTYSKDTRNINKGDTYIGIKGEKYDGNDFWKQAIVNGAKTVIIEKKINEKVEGKNIIIVDNTKQALKKIAEAKRKLYTNLKVIGVTGSVGKTSTKDIIANVLSQKYKTLKTEGNLNNDIGLPFTILKLQDHEVAVIEMGMNHEGEIRELSKIAKPTLAVITNVGTSHIGNLGSRENILKAKLEILEGMEKPKIIINNDNDLLSKWANQEKNIEIHTFAIENNSQMMAKNIIKKENKSEFTIKTEDEEAEIEVPVGGEAFVLNALCATMVGKILDLSNEQIQKGIKTFELTKKRMEITKENGITVINDSYNASFDSMKGAIEYLADLKANRKIAVLGDMFELGNFAKELHKKVGKEVVKSKIDKIYAIGENAKYIAQETEKNNICTVYVKDTQELIENIEKDVKEGDAWLFKASNGMKLFEIAEEFKRYLKERKK